MGIISTTPLAGSEQLFNRVARLTVGLAGGGPGVALQVTGLHMAFKIKKSVRHEPSASEITVYNLTKAHRAAIRQRGLPLILEAGYTNTLGQIFSGVVRYADSVRQGPDWITKIECGDGEVSYRFARLSQAWGPTTVQQVAAALVNAIVSGSGGTMGVAQITQQTLATMTQQLPRGYAVNGPASLSLDRLLQGYGYEYHINDGKIVVLRRGQTTGETAVLLAYNTGLLGSPEHGTPDPAKPAASTHTLKIKSLLQPTLKPAGLIQVQADGIGATTPAFFRIQTIEMEGDTFSGPWWSTVEANPTS